MIYLTYLALVSIAGKFEEIIPTLLSVYYNEMFQIFNIVPAQSWSVISNLSVVLSLNYSRELFYKSDTWEQIKF